VYWYHSQNVEQHNHVYNGDQKYITTFVVLPIRYENNCNTIKSHKHIAGLLLVILRHIYHRNGDILNSLLNVGDIERELQFPETKHQFHALAVWIIRF